MSARDVSQREWRHEWCYLTYHLPSTLVSISALLGRFMGHVPNGSEPEILNRTDEVKQLSWFVTAGSIGKVSLTRQLSNHVWWPSWEDTCWRKRAVCFGFNLESTIWDGSTVFSINRRWIKATVLIIGRSDGPASSWFSHLQINMGGCEKERGSVVSVCPVSQKVMVSYINRDVWGEKILVSFGMLPLLVEVTSEGNMSVALETLDVMSS